MRSFTSANPLCSGVRDYPLVRTRIVQIRLAASALKRRGPSFYSYRCSRGLVFPFPSPKGFDPRKRAAAPSSSCDRTPANRFVPISVRKISAEYTISPAECPNLPHGMVSPTNRPAPSGSPTCRPTKRRAEAAAGRRLRARPHAFRPIALSYNSLGVLRPD
jgi:hypothetical protein